MKSPNNVSTSLNIRKNKVVLLLLEGFPGGSGGQKKKKKKICPQCGRPRFDPWVGKIPWVGRRKWQPTLAFLPGESNEQKSLEGLSHGVAKR